MNNGRKIVYMDWNSLKGIKDSAREPFKSIGSLLRKYKDKIVIPYSPSHLADLNFLKNISGNNIIAKYFEINETRFEERDLIKFFHKIRQDKEKEQPISKIFDEIHDDYVYFKCFKSSSKNLCP